MAFLLSVFYFVVYYLSPAAVFGQGARYRPELILAALILLVSIPAMLKSFAFKTPESPALLGLCIAVFLSVLIGLRWPGGAVTALLGFIPSIYAYFLVCLHCDSLRKLRILVLMLLFASVFVIAHGAGDLIYGSHQGVAQAEGQTADANETADRDAWNLAHPYLLFQKSGSGEFIYRIRGLGEIHDPNDLGQFLVCVLPLLFVFWRRGKYVRNFIAVMVPAAILLAGIYLTHSRGALLALIVVLVLAARRRIGLMPSAVLAGVLLAAAMALQFTGGRAISADAGEDRTALWGTGLQLFKAHPIFGVGFNNFADAAGLIHTAHNSVIVCAAELGFFGLFFWSLFLFPAVRNALVIASPKKVTAVQGSLPEPSPLFPPAPGRREDFTKEDVNRIGHLLVLSLAGFLVAGWFLSRAFVMTFFLLGGISEVVYQMALKKGMVGPRLPLIRVLIYVVGLAIGLVILAYGMVRVLNLAR